MRGRRRPRGATGRGLHVSRAARTSAGEDGATRTSLAPLFWRSAARETRFHPEETPTDSASRFLEILHASNGGFSAPNGVIPARAIRAGARASSGSLARLDRDDDLVGCSVALAGIRAAARECHGHGDVVLDARPAHRETRAAGRRADGEHGTKRDTREPMTLEIDVR